MSTSESQSFSSRTSISRRELLGYASLAAVAGAIGALLNSGFRFATPPAQAGEFGSVFDMGPAAEVPPPGSAPVNVPEARFWLVNTNQGVVALHKACTHLDCLCDWDDPNREFVCPCHGSRFAEDGTYLQGPAARSLDRFVVQVKSRDGVLIAESDPLSGGAVPLAPQIAPRDASLAEVPDEEEEANDPGYMVFVDTGRKIPGAVSRQG